MSPSEKIPFPPSRSRRPVLELSLLHAVSRTLLTVEEPTRALKSLLRTITGPGVPCFRRGFIFLADPDGERLSGRMGTEWVRSRRGTARGSTHRDIGPLAEALSIPLRPESGVLALTALSKAAYRVIPPFNESFVNPGVWKALGRPGSFATSPLLSEGKVLGVLWVDNRGSRTAVREADLRFLTTVGMLAGLALERAERGKALEEAHRQVLDLHNRLIQWERMAALGEMAAALAHEIRNPLVSIGGFARRLLRLLPAGSTGKRYADIVVRETVRLERNLGDLLSLAGPTDGGEKAEVSVDEFVEEAVGLFGEDLRRRGVRFNFHPGAAGVRAFLDPLRIKQALGNLLLNAGQTVGEGGEVTVETFAEGADYGKLLHVRVTDTGGGIPPEAVGRIFDPFFTTKKGGTGLGLPIAQRAVAEHGGEIRVDNRPGTGVSFTIILPLGPPQEVPGRPEGGSGREDHPGGG